METMTFSYLDYATHSDLVSLLKRFAKNAKASDTNCNSLAFHQDWAAHVLGFKNWSMLHKSVNGLKGSAFDRILSLAVHHKDIGPFIRNATVRTINVTDAIDEMKTWARSKYSRLIDFAYYDNESETGYSWPNIEMSDELEVEFGGRFPFELIRKVGDDIDGNEGPWGLEENGDD